MDIVKEIQKKADEVLKDDKKKEQVGDAVENVLKEAKKHVKDKNAQKTIESIIKGVDDATSQKKKNQSS